VKNQPRNIVFVDGLPWIKRAGRLWGDYDVCSEYTGIARSSFPVFVWRHGVKTIRHGRIALALKSDLDEKSGAALQGAPKLSERLPLRARHRSDRP
jgi:hypothetical protein